MKDFHDKVQQNRRVQRRMATCFCVALFIFLASLSAYFVLQFEPVQRKYFYVYPYHETVMKYAEQYHVDSNLTAAVIKSESKFKHEARSHRGAVGLMQLMPDTAASLGVNPYDKQQNIEGGAKYLRQMLDTFGGDVSKAVAAYNAGPQAVKDYGGIPPYKETQNYVNKVLDIYR